MSWLRRLAAFSLVSMSGSAAYAQAPAEADGNATAADPDVVAAEELVREIRAASEVARKAAAQYKKDKAGEPSEPPKSVEVTLDDIYEAGIKGNSRTNVQDQIEAQQARVDALRQIYSDAHPEVIKAVRRLEQLQTLLDRYAFEWHPYQTGIHDEASFQSYMAPMTALLEDNLARRTFDWYGGDAEFKGHVSKLLGIAAASPRDSGGE